MTVCFSLPDYTDTSAEWLSLYESPEVQDIPKEVARLWKQLRPLYLQLHAYVRRKLYLKYGGSVVDPRKGIPAHLLGSMWGQIWDNLLNISQPFPDTPSPNVTEALKQQVIILILRATSCVSSSNFE
ncbi:unnamed protein product, partial [Timema podura]|nr:unnamed protein product [Timema podura]